MKRRDWLQSVLGFVAMTLAGDRVLARYSSDKKPPTPTPPVAPPPAEVVELGGYELQSTEYVPTAYQPTTDVHNIMVHELEHAVGQEHAVQELQAPTYKPGKLVFATGEGRLVTLHVDGYEGDPIVVSTAEITMPTPQYRDFECCGRPYRQRVMDSYGAVQLHNLVAPNQAALDRLTECCKNRPTYIRITETVRGKAFSVLVRDAYLDQYGWSVLFGELTVVCDMTFKFLKAGAYAR